MGGKGAPELWEVGGEESEYEDAVVVLVGEVIEGDEGNEHVKDAACCGTHKTCSWVLIRVVHRVLFDRQFRKYVIEEGSTMKYRVGRFPSSTLEHHPRSPRKRTACPIQPPSASIAPYFSPWHLVSTFLSFAFSLN